MVVALGPGRFYGSGLPRPRFFGGGDRVDPPPSVTDPLLVWAREAHWSMGGLSSKRLRLQGRIEGSLAKLRRRRAKARNGGQKPASASLAALGSDDDDTSDEEEAEAQEKILKQEVVDEEEDEEEDDGEEALVTIAVAAKRKRARKLGDEFDRIAAMQQDGEEGKRKRPAAVRTSRTRKAPVMAAVPTRRTSPRKKR